MATMINGPDDGTWRTPSFRQNMVSKIEEAIQHCGAPTSKNAAEMENQVYTRATGKNEYLSFVARLIIHIKEMGSKKMGAAGGAPQMQNQGGQVGGPQQVNMMGQPGQQMNINMGGGAGQTIINPQQQQQQQQQHIMPGQGGNMMGGGAVIGHQQQQQPQSAPITSMGMGGLPPHSMTIGQPGGQGGHPPMVSMSQQPNPIVRPHQQPISSQGMTLQQSQGQSLQNQGGMGGHFGHGGGVVQQQQPNQQQSNPQMVGVVGGRMGGGMIGGRMMASTVSPGPGLQNPLNRKQGALPPRQMAPSSTSNPPAPPNGMGMGRAEHGISLNRFNSSSSYSPLSFHQIDYGGGGAGVGGGMARPPTSGPTPGGGAQFLPPSSQNIQAPPAPSPNAAGPTTGPPGVSQSGGFVNSPQPAGNVVHPHGSPAPQNRPNQMVPSPNTPMPVAATPSPRNVEDLACMEKIKELRKYTDLLQRMIAKIGNDDMEKSSKMKKLLEILTNQNQRVSMDILLKCEVALKRMEKNEGGGGVGGALGPASQPMPTKEQVSPFQQIQDAILSTLKNGSSSHTLLRTCRPTIEALTGQTQPYSTSFEVPESESGLLETEEEDSTANLPPVLISEIKILDSRFQLKVRRRDRRSWLVVVHLNERKLPRVPPLKILLPNSYPDESPAILDLHGSYSSTPLLSGVAKGLCSRQLYLPEKFTLLQLLGAWEMAVRQASNPNLTQQPKPASNLTQPANPLKRKLPPATNGDSLQNAITAAFM